LEEAKPLITRMATPHVSRGLPAGSSSVITFAMLSGNYMKRSVWNWSRVVMAVTVALAVARLGLGDTTTKPARDASSQPTFDVDWDFSKAHTPTQVEWPPERAKFDFTDIDGKRSVRIRVDKDHVFTGKSRHIYCTKDADGLLLQEVNVDAASESLAEASERGSQIIKEWGMVGDDISAWKAKAAKGDDSTYTASNMTLKNPSISVEIVPAGRDKWHVIVNLFWEPNAKAK
jgi:hypothetical protein